MQHTNKKQIFKMIFIMASACLLLLPIISFADECNIIWSGDESGSLVTQETSRTLQAARQLERTLLPPGPGFVEVCSDEGDPDTYQCSGCRATKPGWLVDVCLTGTYTKKCLYSNPECGWTHTGTWDVVCESTTTTTAPTLITLASFTADADKKEILLRWSTASELYNAGFNLYRADSEEGPYTKINVALIPAKGSATQGAEYEFVDKDVRLWRTYFYKLEDIDLNGTATMHGPVAAMPRLLR